MNVTNLQSQVSSFAGRFTALPRVVTTFGSATAPLALTTATDLQQATAAFFGFVGVFLVRV